MALPVESDHDASVVVLLPDRHDRTAIPRLGTGAPLCDPLRNRPELAAVDQAPTVMEFQQIQQSNG
jgi:hypothetical protein